MSSNKTNTFSFNNFKAFGENMQTFSEKPITLIYGPNSIGKSSLLHSSLYYEAIDGAIVPEKQDILNFKKSNFAGDELNLGGYQNFIHNKDTDNTICYSRELNTEETMAEVLPASYRLYKALVNDGLAEFTEAINNEDNNLVKLIQTRVQNYQQKNGLYYFTALNKIVYEEEGRKATENFLNHFVETNHLNKISTDIEKILEHYVESNLTLTSTVCRKDGQELDVLDKALLLFLDNYTAASFYDSIDLFSDEEFILQIIKSLTFYVYIGSIQNITLNTIVFKSSKKNKLHLKNQFHIDSELIFELLFDSSGYNFKTSIQNDFFKTSDFKIPSEQSYRVKNNVYEFRITPFELGKMSPVSNPRLDILLHTDQWRIKYENTNQIKDITLYLTKKTFFGKKRKLLQYIGPLRWVPSRADLFQDKKYIANTCVNHSDNITADEYMKSFLSESLEKTPKVVLKYRILRMMWIPPQVILLVLKLIPRLFKEFSDSRLYKDATNYLFRRSNKNKHTDTGAKTSEKMWMDFIASKTIQDEINTWLGDETKLKSTYKVEVQKDIRIKGSFKNFFKSKIMNKLSFIDLRTSTPISIRDMGLGISQVLPILISSKMMRSTEIFLEQPELHLHPSVQSELADEFIKSYKDNNNKFMIETHSEHLLLRIMKRMRYTADDKEERDKSLDLTPDDVCILYVDNDGESTYIKELRLSKKGTLLDHWPNGFFEDGYKERFS